MEIRPDRLRCHDLEIHVLPTTGEGHPVHVRSSRYGEASVISRLDESIDWLRDTVLLLNTGQLGVDQLERCGALLFSGQPETDLHGLLSGPALEHFRTCLGAVLATPDLRLHLTLRIDPPELAALPWEYLFDPVRRVFLATDPRVSVVRSIAAPGVIPVTAVGAPFRGLIIAPPTTDLDQDAEITALLSSTAHERGRIRWEILDTSVSAEAIQSRLRANDFHVLHFSGHGAPGRSRRLVLDSGGTAGLSERGLADLVLSHPSLRLVVLNACESGQIDPDVSFGGMAQRLLHRDVAAVVVMQRHISDHSAVRFSRALYDALFSEAAAGDIAAAMNLARAALLVGGPEDHVEFGVPVLYLRARDPVLFDLEPGERHGVVRDAVAHLEHLERVTPRVRGLRPLRRSRTALFGMAWLSFILLSLGCRLLGATRAFDTWRQDRYVDHLASPVLQPDVIIVDLDDDVAPWPWRRGVLVDLIERVVTRAQVRSVALDVRLWSQSRGEPLDDFRAANLRLAEVIHRARANGWPGSLILAVGGTLSPPGRPGEPYRLTGLEAPPAELSGDGIRVGVASLLAPDTGGPVRQAPLLVIPEGDGAPPVAYAMSAAAVTGDTPPVASTTAPQLLLGGVWIDTGPSFRVEIPPVASSFPAVLSAHEIMAGDSLSSAARERLRGRIAVLGRYTDNAQEDRKSTRWGQRSGVAIQATLIAGLLRGRCHHQWDAVLDLFFDLSVLGTLGLLVMAIPTAARRLTIVLAALALTLVAELTAFKAFGLWINGPVPELALLSVLGCLVIASRRASDGAG